MIKTQLSQRRSFAHISQVLGSSFVDITLDPEERELPHPPLFSAFKTTSSPPVVLEIIKSMKPFVFRAIPVTSTTDGLFRGQPLEFHEISIPTGTSLLGRSLNAVGEPIDDMGSLPETSHSLPLHSNPPRPSFFCPMEQLHTGIKAIDVLCPFAKGGKNGIVGFPGKTTLLRHLLQTLNPERAVYCAIASRSNEMAEFMETPHANTVLVNSAMDECVGARLRVSTTAALISESLPAPVLLVMDDLSRFQDACEEVGLKKLIPNFQERISTGKITALQGMTRSDPLVLATFDATLVLDPDRAQRGLYPAIDFFTSQSSLMDSTFLGERHVNVANAVVAALHRERELRLFLKTTGLMDDLSDEGRNAMLRGKCLSNYLTQDLEVETNCELEQTLQDCEDILAGKYDTVSANEFFMIGNLK